MARPPDFPSDMPLQTRFPVRSRKGAADFVSDPLTTGREDLSLAPAHEAVLALTSANRARSAEQAPEDGHRDSEDFSDTNRTSTLPLLITAVAGVNVQEQIDDLHPLSSAGTHADLHVLCNTQLTNGKLDACMI